MPIAKRNLPDVIACLLIACFGIAAIIIGLDYKLGQLTRMGRTPPDILTALIRGDVDMAIESPTAFAGAIKGNQVNMLAVTGLIRNPSFPDVPTAREAGIDGYEVAGWNALYTLAGAPDDAIAKLHDAIVKVAAMPEIQKRFAELGTSAGSVTPEEMADRFESDRKKWTEVIETAGIVFFLSC